MYNVWLLFEEKRDEDIKNRKDIFSFIPCFKSIKNNFKIILEINLFYFSTFIPSIKNIFIFFVSIPFVLRH